MPVMEYRQAVFKAPAGATEIAPVRRGETANKLKSKRGILDILLYDRRHANTSGDM